MELGEIAVRALVAYVYLLLMIRLSGKRVVGQATPFDLVIGLILGDLIDDCLWAEVPASQFVVAVGAILFCDAVVKVASCRSRRVFLAINGRPTILLEDGKEDREAMGREQLSEADLDHLVRLRGLDRTRWKEIRRALMELDHHLSVLRHRFAIPAQKRDAPALNGGSR
jgi:uncharacterized membrane protein YcaP (DUF421 family)